MKWSKYKTNYFLMKLFGSLIRISCRGMKAETERNDSHEY